MALSNEDQFWCVSAAYHAWCLAYDALKLVKAQKWDKSICPKSDWPQLYQHNLEDAIKRASEAEQRLKRIQTEFKDSIPKI